MFSSAAILWLVGWSIEMFAFVFLPWGWWAGVVGGRMWEDYCRRREEETLPREMPFALKYCDLIVAAITLALQSYLSTCFYYQVSLLHLLHSHFFSFTHIIKPN